MIKTELLEQIKRGNLLALQYASEELRGDPQVLLEAVTQNGIALVYASEKLKGDRELVLAAVKQNDSALEYASEELRADLNFIKEVIKQNPKLAENLKFILKAVRQNFLVLRFAEEKTITEAINQLSKEIPAANAYGVDPVNIYTTRNFFENMKKKIITEELCCNIESFNHFFRNYSIRYNREPIGYIPYVTNLFQSECKLSERDAFILAKCIDIAINFSLNEKEEELEFLKSLLVSMVIPIAEEKQPPASIQPDGLTQSNVTQHFTQ